MKKNKKAQITLFVIIGIVILVAFGTYFYISSVQITEEFKSEGIIEDVPVQFQPVRAFVDSCVIKTSTEALTKIGGSGGYINLADQGIISNSISPTESSAFRFFPEDENSGVAYWDYFKSQNTCKTNCECSSETPYLRKNDGSPSIEAELEKYIDENMKSCLNNFASFRQGGYIIEEKGQLKTTVTIAENDIPVLVEYPINIKKDASEADVKNFFVRIPLDLGRIYELALELTKRERKYTYLERWTQEEINAFGLGLDKNSIPPTMASTFDPGESPVTWLKTKSKELLTDSILPYYTSLFQVFRTANYRDRTGTYYERATLPIASPSGKSYDDLVVNFEYLNWWPIYFDIRGRGVSGNSVGPEEGSFPIFEWIGIQRYNLYYDVSYPVRVNIHDSRALNNKGYDFFFGLESNVRSNKPLNCSGSGRPLVVGPTASLLCNKEMACANVTIKAIDAKTNEQIENVLVTYGTEEQCNIGRISQNGNEISLKAELPSCAGCSLLLSKEGYFSYPLVHTVRCDDTNCDKEEVLCNGEELILEIEPKRTISATVKKKRMMKSFTWSLNNAAVNLLNDEFAVLTLEKIKEDLLEEDIIISQIIDKNQPVVELSGRDGLVPGKYSASIQLFYQFPDINGRTGVVFKEKQVCAGKDITGSCDEWETIGPKEFNDTFPQGFSQTNFTLGEDIDDINKIIFHVISTPDSSSFEMLDMDDFKMMDYTKFNEQYKLELEPTFE